jgi:hypothetical protein
MACATSARAWPLHSWKRSLSRSFLTQATTSLNQATCALGYASLASSNQPLELAFFADDGLTLNGIDLRVTGDDD